MDSYTYMCTSALTNPCFKSYTNSVFTHSCRQPFNVVLFFFLHYQCLVCAVQWLVAAYAFLSKCTGSRQFCRLQSLLILTGLYYESSGRQLNLAFAAYYSCCSAYCYRKYFIPVRGQLQLWTLFPAKVSSYGSFGCYYSSRGKLARPHPVFLEC